MAGRAIRRSSVPVGVLGCGGVGVGVGVGEFRGTPPNERLLSYAHRPF
jgi:hypothetical protein